MKHFFRHSAFTMVELLIAILISFIVLAGVAYFFVRISSEITDADRSTRAYIELTDFIQQTNILSRQFPRGDILSDGSSSFNALLFSNPKDTAGALVGVVSLSGSTWRLDPGSNYTLYGEKRLAIRELDKNTLAKIRTSSGYAWTGTFFSEDRTFPNLITNYLSITPYNSGTIFDVNLRLYRTFDPSLVGVDLRDIKFQKQTDFIPINIVF